MSVKVNVSQGEMEKILSSIREIIGGVSENDIVEIVLKPPAGKKEQDKTEKAEATMTSREVADVLGRTHSEVVKQISRLLYVGKTDGEKEGFTLSSFVCSHRNHRSYPMYLMTEKACKKYRELVAENGCGIRMVTDAVKRFDRAIEERFHPERSKKDRASMESGFLLEGKPRSEYETYCNMFDRFITGPGVEGREIAELTEKYQRFYEVMKATQLKARESNALEAALFDVATEAECQGFIYGFKLFDAMLSKSLVTA